MKKMIRVFALVLSVVLCAQNMVIVSAEDATEYEEQAEKEQEKADKLKEQKEELEAKQKELKLKLSALAGELKNATDKLEKKQLEIAEVQDKLDAAKIEERKQYGRMKLRIQFMYECGDVNVLELLFESKSIVEMLNKVEYVRRISDYDREKLVEFQETVKMISETEEELEKEEQELQKLQDEVLSKQNEANRLLESANLELASLEEELGAAQEKVEELLEQAKRARAEQTSKPSGSGSAGASQIIGEGELAWPTTSKRITSYYGNRVAPVAGATSWHDAIDIGASIGTPVYSVQDGTVITASWGYNGGRGNYVMVDHGNGLVTRYQHLSDFYVKVGQTVKKGENIAAVGNTGASSGPHLDFAIYVNGSTVDPLTYY